MLDDQKFSSAELIVAHHKKDIFKYCKSLSNNVQLKDDYMDIDFTICIKKIRPLILVKVNFLLSLPIKVCGIFK